MKSRKSGLFGKRTKRAAAASSQKSTLRKGSVETLEKRELLAGDIASSLASLGFFTSPQAYQSTVQYLTQRAGGGSTSGGAYAPEGGPSDIINVAEQESNNGIAQAQLVPLQGNFGVNISGSTTNVNDEDWYAFDLEAGDILDARLAAGAASIANFPLLSMYNASNRELVASTLTPTAPADSPLTGSPTAPANLGDVALHYTVPTDGRYYIRVSDVGSTYNLALRQYRSTFESEPAGTQQIIYLDFDGAVIPRNLWAALVGVPGSARFSPLSRYLPGYGLQASDEAAFIDEIVDRVQFKFDALGRDTTNPNYGIEIRNSKDHPDPWGQPNVSRVVVGGTWQELVGDPTAASSGILGIAESVDFGNFDRTETAIVMQDVLLATYGAVQVSSASTQMEAIAELMAMVITHEAGHFLGGWHQDPTNNIYGVMDQFYDPIISSGSGLDAIFGTADDAPLLFNVDGYAGGGTFFEDGGINDTINAIGWGLTSGLRGTSITGRVYQDNNLNRTFDAGDVGLPGTRVYADLNGNAAYDSGEFSAFADASGLYELTVPAGTYTIRQEVAAGFRLTNPVDNRYALTVNGTGTVANINFGQERLNQNFTGMKWNDSNANGLRDPGEAGIAGVWIYVDLDGDNRIDLGEPSTQTDARGNYRLNFPGVGTYAIREVMPPGYVQTFPGPSNDNEHTVVLTGNPIIDADRAAGLNFGNTLTVDFGDAPATFGVASHGFVPALRLGVNWDAEQASQHSADALGDDNNGASQPNGDGSTVIDDEDGVSLVRPLAPGVNQLAVVANNTTGAPAYLSAWVDFNQNGVFSADEKIVSDQIVGTGVNNVSFTAPATAALGNTFARFRYSNEAGLGPTGASASGEVEDYVFQVVADRQFTVNDTASVSRNSILNSIDVLANDFKLPGESLTILSNSGSTAGATISISSDNKILYSPPSGFIGQDVFTYTAQNSFGDQGTATVVVDVRLFFANPVAVDDSFDLPGNSIDFPLNVLANDIEGQNGALSIVSITQPDKGGAVSIATGGKSLRYTPLRGFGGTEFFTYTVADSAGNTSTAQVTLHTLPGDRLDDDVLIQLVARDMSGNIITAIPQGEKFVIDVMVDDLRYDAANPGAAAGVFAAYADILYNLQLVSTTPAQPGDRLNFEVEFFEDFDNGQRGDATVPGIVDDFGAFIDLNLINRPEPTRMARITFDARSPGVARFMPDPADVSPATDTLLFDTSSSAVPKERIRYIGTMVEIVGDGSQFPVAVDDSLPGSLNRGVINAPVNVLANDIAGSTGSISIAGFDASTQNGGTVRLNTSGTGLLYTPRSDFQGTDQFTYTIQDTRGIQSVAQVTLRVGEVQLNDIVGLDLEATDANGNPIDEVTVGSNFQLRGYVQDLRSTGANLGIFAAYQDVLFSSNLVSVIQSSTNDPNLGFEVTFGPNYRRVREGDVRTTGLINEIGAVSTGDEPLGNSRQLLFVINMTANNTGTASFIADPADISPLHDTLTYEPVEPVAIDKIRYGFDSLRIVAGSGGAGGEGFHNSSNALDVNNDGHVSPIDALAVINRLNSGQSGSLNGGGEGETSSPMYIDTNNDGFLSPIDALLVINFLNSSGSGEGEGAAELAALLAIPQVTTNASVQTSMPTATEPGVINIVSNRIAARMTNAQYGPALPSDLVAAQMVDFADLEDDEDDDSLLTALAMDIDGWNEVLS